MLSHSRGFFLFFLTRTPLEASLPELSVHLCLLRQPLTVAIVRQRAEWDLRNLFLLLFFFLLLLISPSINEGPFSAATMNGNLPTSSASHGNFYGVADTLTAAQPSAPHWLSAALPLSPDAARRPAFSLQSEGAALDSVAQSAAEPEMCWRLEKWLPEVSFP